MNRHPLRRALLPLLVLCLTLLAGPSLASAQATEQEPDAGATPENVTSSAETSDTTRSDSGAVSCVFSAAPGEALPGDGGTTVTVEITISVDGNGTVTVASGAGKPADVIFSEGTGSGVNEVPDHEPIVEGESCVVENAGGEDAVPTDKSEEPVTGSGEAAVEDATADPAATPDAETCTVTKETTLPDGTTEKVLSCTP
jgi:hypothetical protein